MCIVSHLIFQLCALHALTTCMMLCVTAVLLIFPFFCSCMLLCVEIVFINVMLLFIMYFLVFDVLCMLACSLLAIFEHIRCFSGQM